MWVKIIQYLPDIVERTATFFLRPVINLYYCLRYKCVVHPLARINGRVVLGPRCAIGQVILKTYGDGKIVIGQGTGVNDYCELFAHGGTTIRIGDNSIVARRSVIVTSHHVFDDPRRLIVDQGLRTASVSIGSDAWLGINSLIMPGVTIHDGCVIGGGAVVSSDIPPYSVAVGAPAKVIKKRGD